MQDNEILFADIDAALHCSYFTAVSWALSAEPHEQLLQHLFSISYQQANVILAKMAVDGFVEFCRTDRKFVKRITLAKWYDIVTAISPQGQLCKYSEISKDDPGKPFHPIQYRMQF